MIYLDKPVDTKIKTDATRDTLEEGEDLKIVCEAHAKPEPIFHLYHHSECGLGKEVSQVQKSRTGEFYLKNITSRQRGNYSCVPKNDVGQGEEASLRVFVRCEYYKFRFAETPRKFYPCVNNPCASLRVLSSGFCS